MPRYFLELAYLGTSFRGFQVQENAQTIQGALNDALSTFYRQPVVTVTSSRTDTGVHARQNFLHWDFDGLVEARHLYHLNALLPSDIVLREMYEVKDDAHVRFDAISRTYEYRVIRSRDPFQNLVSFYYPFKVDAQLLERTAAIILHQTCFEAFAKKHSNNHSFMCNLIQSEWIQDQNSLVYKVKANRFLRGMVRALVATQLRVARAQMSMDFFESLFHPGKTGADFSAPGHGLTLLEVQYPAGYLDQQICSDKHGG